MLDFDEEITLVQMASVTFITIYGFEIWTIKVDIS